MRFVCDKAQAVQALKDCKKVVKSKAATVVQESVRICANGLVRFIGTDLDTFVEAGVVTAEHPEKGCVVVPLKMVEKVVARVKDGDIVFIGEGNDLKVSARDGKQSFTVKGVNPEDFPETPKVDKHSYKVPGTALMGGFEKTIFAASNDETQYYLNGVCVEQQGDKLTMVATDGYRLSKVTRSMTALPKDAKIIVGTKGVNAILSVLDNKEAVEVSLSEDAVVAIFAQERKRIVVKLIEGQFPAYDKVFPTKYDGTMSADVETLIDGIDTVSIMAGETRRVQFQTSKKSVEIESSSDEGDARVEVAASWSGKATARFGFNFYYILDYLKLCKQIGFGKVGVDIVVQNNGTVVSPSLWKQEGWDYLLMPMKV
jgi:DNA polymerase-3 subunit beta